MLFRMLRSAVLRAHSTCHLTSYAYAPRRCRHLVLPRPCSRVRASHRLCTTTATSTPDHPRDYEQHTIDHTRNDDTLTRVDSSVAHGRTIERHTASAPAPADSCGSSAYTYKDHHRAEGDGCAASGSDESQHSTRATTRTRTKTTRRAPRRKLQIAVIGSGPSGCFVASTLTKRHPDVHVDMYESLPVPFGLIRYGVAPDHPSVKNVEQQFLELFQSGRVTWMGNMELGRHLSLPLLLQHYAAVVFATGAPHSKSLGIPGEDLGGVIAVQDWVNYYNTMPFPHSSPRFAPFDFTRVRRVAIIGNGNVALDAARVLSASYRYFAPTDMNCMAVKETMRHNRVGQIDIVGRRSEAHVACTIAEFRELTEFQPNKVRVSVDAFDLAPSVADVSSSRFTSPRAHRRLMELMHKFCVSSECMQAERLRQAADANGEPLGCFASPSHAEQTRLASGEATASTVTAAVRAPQKEEDIAKASTTRRTGSEEDGWSKAGTKPLPPEQTPCDVRFRFHLQPVRILPCPQRRNWVGGVLFKRTDGASQTGGAHTHTSSSAAGSDNSSRHDDTRVSGMNASRQAEDTDDTRSVGLCSQDSEYCVLPCHLVITSLGYDARGPRHRCDRGHFSHADAKPRGPVSPSMSEHGLPLNPLDGTIAHGGGGRVHGMPRVYCAGWAAYGSRGVMAHALYNAQEVAAAVLQDWTDGVWWQANSNSISSTSSSNKDGYDDVGNGASAATRAERQAGEEEKGSETVSAMPQDRASGSTVHDETNQNGRPCDADDEPDEWGDATTMLGKYGLLDFFVEKKLEPVSVAGLQRILHVERERGIDLGKRLEKMTSVRDMLDVALGGDIGKKTNDRVRGICPARPDALLYLKELLDDETDLSDLAHSLARNVPLQLAQDHPPGPIHPSQL